MGIGMAIVEYRALCSVQRSCARRGWERNAFGIRSRYFGVVISREQVALLSAKGCRIHGDGHVQVRRRIFRCMFEDWFL